MPGRPTRLGNAVATLAWLVAGAACAAPYDPPAGYYSAAIGQGAALQQQLSQIMSAGHVQRAYGDFRYSAALTDRDPADFDNILLAYNRESVPATWDSGVTWNREHVWPQSLQPGSASNSARGNLGDPHALRPANPSVNSSRGNKPFGYVDTFGSYGPMTGGHYFPGDADKGDVARSLFYSETRWGPSTGIELVDGAPGANQMGDLESLIAWHYLDPPDTFERRRNHTIYSQEENPRYYTNNRNAYVDRPEFVWSVYVDQENDSRVTIAGAPTGDDGGSFVEIDLGRVLVGQQAPGALELTLNKAGDDGTYYRVTTGGAAYSNVSGRHNAFHSGGPDAASLNVGLEVATTSAAVFTGTVSVDNLDVTTEGGLGRGANDADDIIDLRLTVLDHALASFSASEVLSELTIDFGEVPLGGDPATSPLSIANLSLGGAAGLAAGLDLDAIVGSGDTEQLYSDLSLFSGLGAGEATGSLAVFDPSSPGVFAATYELSLSDEDLPGALSQSLTLTLIGEAVAAKMAGDFNQDGRVDTADYLVWRQGLGAAYDVTDYYSWRDNYGQTRETALAVAVPDPFSAWWVAFAAAAGARRSWTRTRRRQRCSAR